MIQSEIKHLPSSSEILSRPDLFASVRGCLKHVAAGVDGGGSLGSLVLCKRLSLWQSQIMWNWKCFLLKSVKHLVEFWRQFCQFIIVHLDAKL